MLKSSFRACVFLLHLQVGQVWKSFGDPMMYKDSMDWFKGRSQGNHRLSYEIYGIWGFSVDFPLNQAIERITSFCKEQEPLICVKPGMASLIHVVLQHMHGGCIGAYNSQQESIASQPRFLELLRHPLLI